MKCGYISEAIGNISTRHIREAESYEAKSKKILTFKRPFGRAMIVADLAICLIAGSISIFSPLNALAVSAYAHETGEVITDTDVILNTETISDIGEMTGHPLMFYLSGKDIATVCFSCKNEQINFMDWTEKPDEYGNAQNFSVTYGEDNSEYYYLLIDWMLYDSHIASPVLCFSYIIRCFFKIHENKYCCNICVLNRHSKCYIFVAS